MGEVPERDETERFDEAERLLDRLKAIIPWEGEEARQWMLVPNGKLAGKTPQECLQSVAGRAQLSRYVRALEDSNVLSCGRVVLGVECRKATN